MKKIKLWFVALTIVSMLTAMNAVVFAADEATTDEATPVTTSEVVEPEASATPAPSATPKPSTTPTTGAVSNIERLEASDESFELAINKSTTFKVYAIQKDGKEVDITNKPTTTYRAGSASLLMVKAGSLKAGSKAGTTTVTVQYGGAKLTFNVTITATDVKDIAVTPKSVKLKVDGTKQLKVDAIDSAGKRKDVSKTSQYFSDDTEVADVDDEGEIAAIGAGETTITVNYSGIEKQVAVEVTEEGEATIVSLKASEKTVKLSPGKTAEVQIIATFDDESDDDVTGEVLWQSSKGSVATVVDGVITAKANGTATITASLKGKKTTFTVVVAKAKAIKSISVSATKLTVLEGKTATFKVTAVYTDNTKEDVSSKATYTVADEDLIDVKSGKVYSLDGIGATKVTVKYENKLATVNVTVK
jgi:hypothetical protein